MDSILDQKPLGPLGEALGDISSKPSLLGLALGALTLTTSSLNPACDPVFSLAGAAADQLNVPGVAFSASISCPRLDPAQVYVFVNGKEHHDFRVNAASSSLEGSEISFPYGLNATSLVGIIAADVDGYPFTSSFPLHFEEAGMKTPSAEPLSFFDAALSMAEEDLHLAAPAESHTNASSFPSSFSSAAPSPSSSSVSALSTAIDACRKKNPSYPMLRPECQNPPPEQCDFYQSCVEDSIPCSGSPASYAINFGLKNCRKFEHNLALFSAKGNAFVWGTMNCLQRALVPAVSDCAGSGAPTCKSVHDTAFGSHAGCYVANGFCSLQCSDYLAELYTVGLDLFNKASLKSVSQVAEGCLKNVTQIIEKGSCMGDGLKGILKTALGLLEGKGP